MRVKMCKVGGGGGGEGVVLEASNNITCTYRKEVK